MAHYSTVVETFVLSLVLRDMNSLDYSSEEDTATALNDDKYDAMLAAYYPAEVYKLYKARDSNMFDYSAEEDAETALSDDKYYLRQVYKRYKGRDSNVFDYSSEEDAETALSDDKYYKAGDGELAAGTNPVPTLQ